MTMVIPCVFSFRPSTTRLVRKLTSSQPVQWRNLMVTSASSLIHKHRHVQAVVTMTTIRSILSSAVQSRLVTMMERHSTILEEMRGSGHTHSDIGKELSILGPIASLHETMMQFDEEEKSIIELLNDAIKSNDAELRNECEQEIQQIHKKRSKIESRLIDCILPSDDDDYDSAAIIEIRAGTGGDEASFFASELLSCFTKTAKQLNWSIDELSCARTELNGVRDATISISGGPRDFQFASIASDQVDDEDDTSTTTIGPYGFFKFESGVHRVQRIPVNDVKLQTSACSIAVLPLSSNSNSSSDADLLPVSELRIETMRASGAGGQHINTTDSAVRITHIPTGITASIQDGRSQHKNKEQAMKLITARVRDKQREIESQKQGETRSALMGGGDRSERIRTYNFPQDRITDHRCKQTLHGIDNLLNNISPQDGIVVSFLPHLKSAYREELLNELEAKEEQEQRRRNVTASKKK